MTCRNQFLPIPIPVIVKQNTVHAEIQPAAANPEVSVLTIGASLPIVLFVFITVFRGKTFDFDLEGCALENAVTIGRTSPED